MNRFNPMWRMNGLVMQIKYEIAQFKDLSVNG